MRNNVLLYAIAASIACSCISSQEAPEISGAQMVLTAYQEGTPDSKTAVENGGTQVFWEPGDEIKVFSGSRSGRFTSNVTGLTEVTEFTGFFDGGQPDATDFWAVYPYSDEASFDGKTITTVIPSVQVARPGTFAQGANVAIAHSTTTSLQFYNVGGGIRFSLTEEGVTSILLESLNDESLSGTISVGFSGGIPIVSNVINGTSCISITPQNESTFTPGVWYYFVAVPGTLEKGFRMMFYKNDYSGSLEYKNALTIKRKTFASISDASANVSFISNDAIDTSVQELSEQIAPCITSEMNAPEQIASKAAEIEANPSVESVEVGESSTSVLLKTGETLIYPYDYPSAFDDPDSSKSAPRQTRRTGQQARGLDTGYFDADVVIFNLFSEQSGRKNQNKLMENVKYTLENGTYRKSVCYLGLDGFTVENVEKAINNRSIIFFSTLGSTDSKYICTGEEYLVGKPLQDLKAAATTHFVTTVKYEDKYKGEKRYALAVKDLMKKYSGPMMYFASCNSLKNDYSDIKANVVGWDGINQCGQAFALIIADYIANGKAIGAFLKDFTENHSQVGDIIDPLKAGTKLKYLNDGWRGTQYTGFYENVLNQTMKIVSPVPGTCVKAKSKYTISLLYDNPDPSNIITDGKNCVYENGNQYFLGFDNMSGESSISSPFLYADKNSKVNYSNKNFGAGVWRISLFQQGPKDSHGYKVGHSYLIMHKGYDDNDIEIDDIMPSPIVKTLGAAVEDQGVLATGMVVNRTLDGLEKGFQLYQLKSGDISQVLSSNDSLRLVNQGIMIASSVESKGYYGVMLRDLVSGGRYLVRAFATDESNSTSYGDILSFQFGKEDTPPSTEYPTPEAVDLGLSVKWASCNVGATRPEEHGDYFAWGETDPKTAYSWSTYKWCSNGNPDVLLKYTVNSYFSQYSYPVDGKMTLDLEDDAANAALGGYWRMPSVEEMMELSYDCQWTWTIENGVSGYKVSGTKEGYTDNYIFLPVTGRWSNKVLIDEDTGNYWTNSLVGSPSDVAYCHIFTSEQTKTSQNKTPRMYGFAVRPVCPKE